MYTSDSIVAVRPFTRQVEGDEVIIGDVAAGLFLAVPREAVELLDLLAAGKSVGEVSAIYQQATGETPDLDDLLSLLESKGLVEPYGRKTKEQEVQQPTRTPRYHFSNFPQPLARAIFSRNALLLETTLFCLATIVMVNNHSLIPRPTDLVFHGRQALSLTLLLVWTYASVFLHELGHLVATRAVGVSSRMGISHRLWFLVAETDLTGLWSVPRGQRYLPMLAGLHVDIVSTCLLTLLLFAQVQHVLTLSPFTIYLIRASIFCNILRISWEFFLFTRTDLYFVAATFWNCKNLLHDTHVFLRNQCARVFSRITTVDQSAIPAAERRAIRLYAWLFLGGRIWAFTTLFAITIPVTLSYCQTLANSFHVGYSANPAEFLDNVIAACYFLVPTIAGFVLWGRSLMRPKGV